MPDLQPVSGDPFATQPVDYDPFAMPGTTAAPPMPTADQSQDIANKLGQTAALPVTIPIGMAKAAWSGLTYPGDVFLGKDTPDNLDRALDMAGLVAGGGLATGVERGAGESVLGAGPITAYHGSPHDFDAFDLSKIGTGEGAQAYGHGLYFAGNENVANSYRDAGLRSGPIMYKGQGILNIPRDEFEQMPLLDRQTLVRLKDESSIDDAVFNAKSQGLDNIADKMNEWRASGDIHPAPPGRMYQVQINADPEHFLDWDKPLSEQSPHVQQALQSVGIEPFETAMTYGKYNQNFLQPMRNLVGDTPLRVIPAENFFEGPANFGDIRQYLQETHPERLGAYDDLINGYKTAVAPKGEDIYRLMARDDGDVGGLSGNSQSEVAAENLRDAGIPGIKYLDQGSRRSGEGTHNYVIFDDKIVDVLKKYGIAGLMAGGASHFALQPVQGDPFGYQ